MNTATRRSKISQTDIPGVSLDQALRIPFVIADQYAKSPTRPLDVAAALDMSPSSGPFRGLCGAAIGYGLTDGGPNAIQIALTDLGKRIVAPLVDGDDEMAKRQAVLMPTVEKSFLEKYDGSPLPIEKIAYNVLESLGVPADRSKKVYELIVQNAALVGFLKKIKDKTYVDLGSALLTVQESDSISDELGEITDEHESLNDDLDDSSSEKKNIPPSGNVPRSNAIFLGHGKNRKPLDQLVKILDEYGIPHKQATAEANAGRPIPTKVADTMRECGAAILIFTADEKFHDEDGNEFWRPSENVAHELGAASVLYDNRIVVFKEVGVTLASNFSSIGYIEFNRDQLNDKGIELFRELVSFKIINIRVGQ